MEDAMLGQGGLDGLASALLRGRGFAHKRDISDVVSALSAALPGGTAALGQAVGVGDDCAAIPDGEGGYLLFAIEGFVDDFVQRMPWFAGYCGVMVNVSDICAMGGRPVAVVDALWSRGMEPGRQVLEGLAAASQRYGVPIVGGHSNNQAVGGQLAVAILGRAKTLLTSFNARPGDTLVMAIDLRGAYQEPNPYWDASTSAPAERLRADLELLPALAESGLCDAAKDISMAGAVGTALMLLECSQVGGVIDVQAIPRPPGVPLLRWLQSFPSYGYVFSVRPAQVAAVARHFESQGIACAAVGEVTATPQLHLRDGETSALLWDLAAQPFIGARAVAPREPAHV
ncbi:sll0787 family AIR synthase-like protein [Methylibium sp. Pch-M]|uniref:sll0787 family AIR synthase-like protein n=1 Tax=Methylibium sp. Pch-M TaxID=2082386 RepID=UPI0010138FB1|nr:sll0787 family AIR synthase-like protein [Methylibium sp. Pch-M]QAZ39241.1 sll0787 family AIR synthase-like protein [Methylibium sp. Pch-M]